MERKSGKRKLSFIPSIFFLFLWMPEFLVGNHIVEWKCYWLPDVVLLNLLTCDSITGLYPNWRNLLLMLNQSACSIYSSKSKQNCYSTEKRYVSTFCSKKIKNYCSGAMIMPSYKEQQNANTVSWLVSRDKRQSLSLVMEISSNGVCFILVYCIKHKNWAKIPVSCALIPSYYISNH